MAIQFLTADQVAEAIGVSRSTAYRIIKRLNQELENAILPYRERSARNILRIVFMAVRS